MGKERYGEQFRMWQKQAAEFEIDGRPPVRSALAKYSALSMTDSVQLHSVNVHEVVSLLNGQLDDP